LGEINPVSPDSQTSEIERFTCLNLAVSTKGIAEYSGKSCVVFIRREDIQRFEMKFGFRAEHPLIQSIAGALLSCIGIIGLGLLGIGGFAYLRWELGFIFFGGLGVWLLWEALRRGHYLSVVCNKETRKLVFDRIVSEAEIQAFLQNASRLGYLFK